MRDGSAWANTVVATSLLLAGACASNNPTPIVTGTDPVSRADATAYNDPHINGHPVAQCVMGLGWGAFEAMDPQRCGSESQRIIADQFCLAQQADTAAVDWKLEHGKSERQSIWRYDKGSNPSLGNWIRGLGVDRFSKIRCAPK